MTSWERCRWWLRYHRRQAALAVLGVTVVLGCLVALIAVSLQGSNSPTVAVSAPSPVVIPDPVTAPPTVPPTTAAPRKATPTTVAKPKPVAAPKPAPKPAAKPKPAPKPAVAPKPAPAPKPAVAPKPVAAPTPVVAPKPAPAPAPAPAPKSVPAPKPATVPSLTINVVVNSASAPLTPSTPGTDCFQAALQQAPVLNKSGAKVYGPAGRFLGTAYFTKGQYVQSVNGQPIAGCELTAVLANFLAESAYEVRIANGDAAFTATQLVAAKWQATFKFDYGTNQLTTVPPQASR